MAKSATIKVKLLSTAGTGTFFAKKRNTKSANTEKLKFRKYDPKIRKHVEFTETKIK